MPDEKISDLPLTPAINLDDTYEKSRHNAAPSERATHQQLVTFMQTAMALVQLSGGKVTLNADGSVTFANGAAVISALGVATVAVLNVGPASIDNLGQALLKSLTMVDANVAILATGDMTLGGSTSAGSLQILDAVGVLLTALNNDGSASFATGESTVSSTGIGTFTSSAGPVIVGTGALNINGNKVVGSQESPIADAIDPGDAVTQLNSLLAALRAHGLIAT